MRVDVFQVLAAMMKGAATANEILATLRSSGEPGGVPAVPTLYRRLKECLDEGWIEVEETEGVAQGPGRPGLRYRLTRSGAKAARVEAERWRRFVEPLLGGEGRR
jgi:DNA-binding PadR family transcriptional regulator